MKFSRLLSLFPTPSYLSRPAVGLDISDRSIKFIEIINNYNQFKVGKLGEKEIPTGILENGRIKNQDKLVEILIDLKKEYQLKYVVVGLPEEEAYLVRMSLPSMPLSNLRESIAFQLEHYIPYGHNDVVFDYKFVRLPNKKDEVFDLSISAFPKDLADSYYQVLDKAGLIPLVFEIELEAIVRASVNLGDQGVFMVVDIGKTRTSVGVVVNQTLVFTTTIPSISGRDLTKVLEKNLGLSAEEAEEIKIKRGLKRENINDPVFNSLIPMISSLKDEINRFVHYWQTHKNKEESKMMIEKIILCGGQATLPGLDHYLESNLGIPTDVINPWINIIDLNQKIPPINYNESLRYTTAIGLAFKNIIHD